MNCYQGSNQLTGPDLESFKEGLHCGLCDADKVTMLSASKDFRKLTSRLAVILRSCPVKWTSHAIEHSHFLLLLPQSSAHGYGLKPNCKFQA